MSDERRHGRPAAFWIAGFVLLAAWGVSMLWLRGHSGRAPSAVRSTSYGALVPSETHLVYRVMAGQDAMGDLEYSVIAQGSGRRITWRLSLLLAAQGESGAVTANGSSMLDSTGTLSSFSATMALGAQTVEVSGTRREDVMTIQYSGFGASRARVVHVDSTLSVGDGFFPGLIGGCPRRNERLTWQVFDPLTLVSNDVSLERERGSVMPPAPEDGCVLAVVYKGLKTLMWVDAQGVVVRQRTPVGWELVLEPDHDHPPNGQVRP